MESIVITWRELLIAAILVLGVYIGEMLLLLKASGRLGRQSQPVTRPDTMRVELVSLSERVRELEQQIAALKAETPEPEVSPYQRAIQMARQGRDAGRIAESCGIPRGEAELIVTMHAGRHE